MTSLPTKRWWRPGLVGVAPVVLAAVVGVGPPPPALAQIPHPTDITVTAPAPVSAEATVTVGDESDYRAALVSMSSDPGPHEILLGGDIVVDDGADPTYTGVGPLTIDGGGFTLDAAGANRALVVDSPQDAAVSMVDLTLRGGSASGDGGALLVASASPLGLADVTFTGNRATGSGGAVAVTGSVTVDRATFTANRADAGDGGAIVSTGTAASVSINASLFDSNEAVAGEGGALWAIDALPVATSTFVGNQASRGGAVALGGDSVIIDSTFSENRAVVRGGALLVNRPPLVHLIYVTMVGNAAPVAANVAGTDRTTSVLATVVAEPRGGGGNCDPATGSIRALQSYSDDATCGTDGWTVGAAGSVGLGPLQDNGGITPTMMPAPDSPLVDAIDPLEFWGGPTLGCATYDDQRGVSRPQDGNGEPPPPTVNPRPYGVPFDWCDIGAVEADARPRVPVSPVPLGPRFTG